MKFHQTNIDDLIRIYLHDRDIYWIMEEIGKGSGYHYEIIRSFYAIKNSQKQSYVKEYEHVFHSVDLIMDAVSSFEIGAMSGFWGQVGKSPVENVIYKFLNNYYLKYYYERYNPKHLPQIFRLRLESNPEIPIFETTESIQGGLLYFLENDMWYSNEIAQIQILHDKNMLEFASLLTFDKEDFLRHIAKSIEDQEPHIETDILKVYDFFTSFNDCLSGFSSNKLLQSAVWHRHELIFRQHGNFRKEPLTQAFLNMSAWDFDNNEEFQFVFDHHLLQRHSAFLNLCSVVYEKPLKLLMQKLRLIPERELADDPP